MKLRKILSDETGVLYSDGSKQVLLELRSVAVEVGLQCLM